MKREVVRASARALPTLKPTAMLKGNGLHPGDIDHPPQVPVQQSYSSIIVGL